ncbi:MAG: hypothetical protein ABIN01_19885 [Ferruginibacter sp.]
MANKRIIIVLGTLISCAVGIVKCPLFAQQQPSKADTAISATGNKNITPGPSNADPAACAASGGGSNMVTGDTGHLIIDEGKPKRAAINNDSGWNNLGWLGILGAWGLLGLRNRTVHKTRSPYH